MAAHEPTPEFYMALVALRRQQQRDINVARSVDTAAEVKSETRVSCTDWCLANCVDDKDDVVYHVELRFKDVCTGDARSCTWGANATNTVTDLNEITHDKGHHYVMYGVRYALREALLPPCAGGYDDPADILFGTGGLKIYVDRTMSNISDKVEISLINAAESPVESKRKIAKVRAYLDAQLKGLGTCCGRRCGGGYSYTGCVCMPCSRALICAAWCLPPGLKHIICPTWTYREVPVTPDEKEPSVHGNWFCSQLCAAALMAGGVIGPRPISGSYSPARLSNALRHAGLLTEIGDTPPPPPPQKFGIDEHDYQPEFQETHSLVTSARPPIARPVQKAHIHSSSTALLAGHADRASDEYDEDLQSDEDVAVHGRTSH